MAWASSASPSRAARSRCILILMPLGVTAMRRVAINPVNGRPIAGMRRRRRPSLVMVVTVVVVVAIFVVAAVLIALSPD